MGPFVASPHRPRPGPPLRRCRGGRPLRLPVPRRRGCDGGCRLTGREPAGVGPRSRGIQRRARRAGADVGGGGTRSVRGDV